MTGPLRLGIIGCGAHVMQQHIPALLACADALTVVACADPQPAARAVMQAFYPQVRTYATASEVCADAACDAVLIGTPPALTASITREALRSGKKLWIEKPLAMSVEDSQHLVSELVHSSAMMSLNRRFDPAFVALRQWLFGQTVVSVAADMVRQQRPESDFVTTTAIHILDAVIACTGPLSLQSCEPCDGGRIAHTRTKDGVAVRVRIAPCAGMNQERMRVVTTTGEAEVAFGWFDSGDWRHRLTAGSWQLTAGQASAPDWMRNGTLAETHAFIAACRGNGDFSPRPADFLPAARLAAAIRAAW